MRSKRAVWAERIEAWQRSDLSAAAFCRAEGLNYPQFVYWQRAVGATKRVSAKAAMLVPVRIEGSSAGVLELMLPQGLRLRVPAGFPSHEVVALVRGLCPC